MRSDDAGARSPPQHHAHLGEQLVRHVGLERRRMLPCERPARVEHAHPGVELAGQLGERRAESVGPQRGEGDRPLSGEGPAAPRVRLRGDRLGVGARDRDEGRAVGHLEQRHPRGAARVGEQRRDAVAHHLGAEAESDHPAGRESAHVVGVDGWVVAGILELRAGGQQRQSLGQERRRVGEVGAVHPPQRAVEGAVLERRRVTLQPQVQIPTAQQCAQGRGVGDGLHRLSDRCTGRTVATPRMYRAARADAASHRLRSRP